MIKNIIIIKLIQKITNKSTKTINYKVNFNIHKIMIIKTMRKIMNIKISKYLIMSTMDNTTLMIE